MLVLRGSGIAGNDSKDNEEDINVHLMHCLSVDAGDLPDGVSSAVKGFECE